MKTLLIMRHAKSSWENPEFSDYDRPLKKRGKRDSTLIGNIILNQGIQPDIILCSSAKRAKDTAELFAVVCGFHGQIQYHRSLYQGAPSDYIELLLSQGNEHQIVMLVGHNPGLEELLSDLTDIDEWLPTAALAHIDLDIEHWYEFNEFTECELMNLWRPREIPG
ncbi:MAG: histidine phosphatase family protein [Anaerolineales bacterium]|nr:histidine phosphatase family protein [Anaerolineales bacterium]